MSHRRKPTRKPNHGAAQVAVAGLISAGSVLALGRGYLAERRSKALDGAVIQALRPWRLHADVHIGPPIERFNPTPRLRELAHPDALSPQYDARKHQLLTQIIAGDIHIGTGPDGSRYIAPPGGPPFDIEFSRRFSRRKRNDASAARSSTARNVSPTWAFAQYDDPVYGSWGIAVDPDAEGADLYRYNGERWEYVSATRWNDGRGRIEGATAPAHVLDGLAHAMVASPQVREALHRRLGEALKTAFTGRDDVAPTLGGGAGATFRAIARARCSGDKATRSRSGTKTAAEALRAHEHDVAVARAALAELCGVGDAPIGRGGPCDRTLDALRAAGPSLPCSIGKSACPHTVGSDEMDAWRIDGMPEVGPYETDKPHEMGADPCCFYHPATQARLNLRRKVEATSHALPGTPEWFAAVQAAESASPHAGLWERCDEMMRRRFKESEPTLGEGRGNAGTFLLLKGFYDAVKSGNTDQQWSIYHALKRVLGDLPSMEEFSALDAHFWDYAVQEARDTGNLGYKRWVQSHGGRAGRNVFKRYDARQTTVG